MSNNIDDHTPTPAAARENRRLAAVLVAVILLALWFSTRSWHAPILDRHEFRQLQTALSTYWMVRDGFSWAYETPIFGPPWSLPMEFPVYQWIVATVSGICSFDLETTARGVSLLSFMTMLPAVAVLARKLGGSRSDAMLLMMAALASPTYLFYGRTFLIETTATALNLWFLVVFLTGLQKSSWLHAAAATGLGLVGALAKVTTFLIFCPTAGAAAVYFLWIRRSQSIRDRFKLVMLAAVPVAVSVGIAYWWVRFSDQVKSSNPYSGFLVSSETVKWNWGTIDQRLSAEFWHRCWENVTGFVMGETSMAVLLVAATFVGSKYRRLALLCLGGFVVGILTFSSLFFFHDYYYCANAILLLIAAGLILAGIWSSPSLPTSAKWVMLGLFLLGQFTTYYTGYADYARRKLPDPPGIARIIRHTTPSDSVILIYGWDWNTLVPYYSQRKALMVPNGRENNDPLLEGILAQMPGQPIAGMLIHGEALKSSQEFVRSRAARFHLSPIPLVTSEAGDLYLPYSAMAAARRELGAMMRKDPKLNRPRPASTADAEMSNHDPAGINIPTISPQPISARSRFGFSTGLRDGRPIVNAHAPSALYFQPRPEARSIHAVFGLADGAWVTSKPPTSDGIKIEITEEHPDGTSFLLYERFLDPVRVEGDRGPQAIDLPEVGPFQGELVFRISPGPDNNVTKDWGYWQEIIIN